jgi:hypothetical protein
MPTAIRRATVAALTFALLVPAAALGKALFRTGKYRGADGAHYLKIAFTAGRSDARELTFSLKRMPDTCTTGGTLSGSQVPYDIPEIPIGEKGVFKLSAESKEKYVPTKVMIRGTLKGSAASGSFRLTYGPLDDGTTCDTGKVSWTAKRRS